MALSQRIFSKRKFPKGIFPSGNFPNVQFLKCQLPKSVLAVAFALKPVLAAALGHLTHPSLSAYCSAPIAASCTACEIAHLGSCHLGNCHLGSRTWENAFGKVPKTKNI